MANDNTHTSQDPYPVSCPFCAIAATYPSLASPLTSHQSQDTKGRDLAIRLKSYVPEHTDHEKLEPNSHIVLQAPETMAFLDIMPMTAGHLLVTSRKHFVKVEDLPGTEAQDIGFWLPILAKAVMKTIECTDYNIVQNNGPRAAQVVPHVHFHIIPRPDTLPSIQSKSWTMFGRGRRDDLDDSAAAELAAEIRRQVRKEIDSKFYERSLI